ncbi:DUF223 domain protein [Medicago truncatula]|uniref:DUF223 domain protein n=1 Tax=Medicago truncatula TaxID=3880 RepID=G7IJ18_MEDTR|nr:DUF223 domain protein [Medicago truncatula]
MSGDASGSGHNNNNNVPYDYGNNEKSDSGKVPKFNGDPEEFSWWKTNFYSHVMVLDLWIVIASNGRQHLELIIGDAKGDRVHVITRQADFQRLKSLIEENQTYVLHNCLMFDNDVSFKPVDYHFKLVFGAGTKVTRNDKLTDIPSHDFRFKSFKEIGEGVFKTAILYEIIGVIHEIGKTTMIGGGKTFGNLVEVTLWDRYFVELMTFLTERKDRGVVVLILTHAQCKLADNGKPNLCNNWSGSKLLINLKHPVVEAFRVSLQAQDHSFDQSLCQASTSSQRSNYDEFSNLSGVKPIVESLKISLRIPFVLLLGRHLSSILIDTDGITKPALNVPKLQSRVVRATNAHVGRKFRYKVVVIMVHDDHKAEFVFWDKECFQILGVAADALRKSMQHVGEDYPHIYPEVLDKLLEIEFALRVKYQPYYHQASVNAFSRDETVIKKIKAHLHPDEIQSEVQKINESIVRNNTTLSSDPKKMSGSGECLRGPTPMVGSCTVAKCLSAGKCEGHPAKRKKNE